jgi:hypothetical protein
MGEAPPGVEALMEAVADALQPVRIVGDDAGRRTAAAGAEEAREWLDTLAGELRADLAQARNALGLARGDLAVARERAERAEARLRQISELAASHPPSAAAPHRPARLAPARGNRPSAGTRSPVVITGMHRSGTSLVAAFCAGLGVHLGPDLLPPDAHNPRGYGEDVEFVRLQREMLAAAMPAGDDGWADGGVPADGAVLDTGAFAAFIPAARDLLARRGGDASPWGWKDPRTTLLLPFWRDLVPDARFVLVYRTPWDAAASLLNVGWPAFADRPALALEAWLAYNRALLAFARDHRDQCVVVAGDRVLTAPDAVAGALERARVPVDATAVPRAVAANAGEPGLLRRSPATGALAALARRVVPEIDAVWEALEALADVPLEPRGVSVAAPVVPLTVVVHCPGGGDAVARTVGALEHPHVEAVVTFDGADDPATRNAIQALRERGTVVLDMPHMSQERAADRAALAARGDAVLCVQAGDTVAVPAVLAACAILVADPTVALAYGDEEDADGVASTPRPPTTAALLRVEARWPPVIVRRSAWAATAPASRQPGAAADLWLRLRDGGWGARRVDAVLVRRGAPAPPAGPAVPADRATVTALVGRHAAVLGADTLEALLDWAEERERAAHADARTALAIAEDAAEARVVAAHAEAQAALATAENAAEARVVAAHAEARAALATAENAAKARVLAVHAEARVVIAAAEGAAAARVQAAHDAASTAVAAATVKGRGARRLGRRA